jgi:hypothetical protein
MRKKSCQPARKLLGRHLIVILTFGSQKSNFDLRPFLGQLENFLLARHQLMDYDQNLRWRCFDYCPWPPCSDFPTYRLRVVTTKPAADVKSGARRPHQPRAGRALQSLAFFAHGRLKFA